MRDADGAYMQHTTIKCRNILRTNMNTVVSSESIGATESVKWGKVSCFKDRKMQILNGPEDTRQPMFLNSWLRTLSYENVNNNY